MASSAEGQGKTIGLIVFFVLFIVAAVVAYMYYEQVDRLKGEAAKEKEEKRKVDKELADSTNRYEKIRELLIGTGGTKDHEQVVKQVNALLQKPDLSNKKNIAFATAETGLKDLQNWYNDSEKVVETLRGEKENLERQIKEIQEKYEGQVKEHKSAQSKTSEDLTAESNKFKQELANVNNKLEEITETLARTRDEREQQKRDYERQLAKEAQNIKELREKLFQMRRQIDALAKVNFEHTDGHVQDVIGGGMEVYVDIGRDDGLLAGTTFSVHGKDVGGSPYKLPKASVEIVRIMEAHRSLGRLTNNTLQDPVLPGDLLYNPVWSPGTKLGVAFVGYIYLDTDEKPDNDEFRRFVERQGGKVDAYYDINRDRVIGEINVNTSWLVIGEIPEDSSDPKKKQKINRMVEGVTILRSQAQVVGVQQLNLNNFLTFIGSRPIRRSIRSGEEDLGRKFDPLPQKGPIGYEELKEKTKNAP